MGRVARPVSMRFTGARDLEHIYAYKVELQPQYLTNQIAGFQWAMVGNAFPQVGAPGPNVAAVSPTGFFATAELGQSWQFTLRDLTNSLALTGLYDSWRLKRVTCDVKLCQSGNQTGSQTIMPTMYAIVDRDDATLPTSLAAISGRPGHVKLDCNDKSRMKFTIDIKPRLAPAVFSAVSGTSNSLVMQSDDAWCDSNTIAGRAPAYYGLKMWFSNVFLPSTSQALTAFQFNFTYHLEFKSPLNLY